MYNSAIQLQPGEEGAAGASVRRNRIINGQFDIWQRGTSFSGPTGFTGGGSVFLSADRWNSSARGGAPAVPIGDVTVNQIDQITFDPGQPDVPDNPTFYLQRQVVIVGGGTDDASILGVFIEDVRTFNGQKATLSFWAKGNIPGDLAVNFVQRFGVGGSSGVLSSEQFFSVTSTWRKYVLVFDVPSIAGKTIGTSDHLQIRFYSHAGNAVFTSGLPVDYTGEFCITNVQFELGDTASDFEDRFVADELALCQRYFAKNQDLAIAPSTAIGPGRIVEQQVINPGNVTVFYPTRMRVNPTLVFFDTGEFGTFVGVLNIGETSAVVTFSNPSGAYTFNYTADAELS